MLVYRPHQIAFLMGQAFCREGPYVYVRHPGCAGGILTALSIGLIFGSFFSLIPGIPGSAHLLVRTYLADRTLKAEFAGYRDYAKQVR